MKKLVTLSLLGLFVLVTGSASAQELWGTGSPDWGTGASGPGPVIFKFDATSGTISATLDFTSYNWMWISGLADSGAYLYASHNTYDSIPGYMDTHDFKIAKIDRVTGIVLSDTSVAGFLGQTFSQINALDFHNGRLYAVENATSGSTIRGYAIEILLDMNGDVIGATRGAYVGPYPDCGLDYHDGLWYATSWGYSGPPKRQGSLVYVSPNIMTTDFTQLGTGPTPGVKNIGMIDGWEFDDAGNLYAVTWYPVPSSATAVYIIDPLGWTATLLYDLHSQLPNWIISLDGLSEVAVTDFKIGEAKIDWKKKPDSDKIMVNGVFDFPEGIPPDPNNVTLTVDSFTFGPIAMEVKDNGKRWEYKGAKGATDIKDMHIQWKKKEAQFEIHIDRADLGSISDWTNPVVFSLQIGTHEGYESVLMNDQKDKWTYHK
jgi:hypothetical protein